MWPARITLSLIRIQAEHRMPHFHLGGRDQHIQQLRGQHRARLAELRSQLKRSTGEARKNIQLEIDAEKSAYRALRAAARGSLY